jgi:hypothetical protein
MPCTAATYTITTANNHNPTWNGTLVVAADGTGTFTLTGSTSGVTVTPECGSDAQGNWIQFTNTHAHPAVHYQKAHWQGTKYSGSCNNHAKAAADVDTWTATPQTKGPRPEGR